MIEAPGQGDTVARRGAGWRVWRALMCAALCGSVAGLWAGVFDREPQTIIDELLQAAWEHQEPLGEFERRAEGWHGLATGEVPSGFSTQLYKGNVYRFTAAVDGVGRGGKEVRLVVADRAGRGLAAVRLGRDDLGMLEFTPERSGQYQILLWFPDSKTRTALAAIAVSVK